MSSEEKANGLKIREANRDEAATLTEIAHEAKRYWGYPEHWIRHWQSDLTILPEFIADNEVFVAEQDAELIGFYALVLNENAAELEHMWVRPAHIGTGVGKQLFYHAMERAAKKKAREVGISSDPNAEPFYLRMGATRTGAVTSEIDGQPRVLPRLTVEPDPS
jgi:GNAT superfamily N-acetyltransferase